MLAQDEGLTAPLRTVSQPDGTSPEARLPRPGTVKARLTPKRPRRQVENDEYGAFVRRILRAYSRRVGDGDGTVVERGMRPPVSFHAERLRQATPGYFFDAITNGFGTMFDLSDRISAEDRWAIVAYVRALQRSQSASLADAPPAEREKLTRAQ